MSRSGGGTPRLSVRPARTPGSASAWGCRRARVRPRGANQPLRSGPPSRDPETLPRSSGRFDVRQPPLRGSDRQPAPQGQRSLGTSPSPRKGNGGCDRGSPPSSLNSQLDSPLPPPSPCTVGEIVATRCPLPNLHTLPTTNPQPQPGAPAVPQERQWRRAMVVGRRRRGETDREIWISIDKSFWIRIYKGNLLFTRVKLFTEQLF